MRFSILIAFAGTLIASPALADITAHYRKADGGPDVVVQANDRGDSRATVTSASYLVRDGEVYILLNDAEGSFVARSEDFLALLNELESVAAQATTPANDQPTITEVGEATIAGRAGRVFRIRGASVAADNIEIVISMDPDLAPIGAAMSRAFAPFFSMRGQRHPRVGEAVREIMSRGAVLRLGSMFELESISTEPLPGSLFELPSPPLSREALVARLQLSLSH